MSSTRLGRRFWILWSGATATNLGDGLGLVAFPLLAIGLTDDARLVALISVARFLPFLILGLPAGVLLDRHDRRQLAVLAQLLRATVVLGLSAAILADRAGIGLLMFAAFAIGAGEVITDGGLPAIVRNVVAKKEQLELANSRLAATQTVSNMFIGPPLGALLFQLHPAIPFLATAAMFVLGAAVLTRLPGNFVPQRTPDDASEPFRVAVTAGLRYVWGHPVLRPLAFAVAVYSFFGEAGNAVFVLLATERFGLSEVGFGALLSVDAVAAVVMSFFVARLIARTSHAFSMRLSIVTFALASMIFGFSTALVAAVLAAVMQGIGDPSWNVVSATIRQRLVPDEVFGRMMTAYLFIAWGLQPLGALMGGFVAEAWGAQWVYVIGGCAVGSLLLFGQPLFSQVKTAMAPEASS